MKPERRTVTTEFEYRSEGDSLYITGYALKWDTRSKNLGGFKERVSESATKKTIQESDIRALFNHDPNLILGRNRSGTLRLTEDSTGLEYEVTGDLRQSYVRDLSIALERGDVNQSSFAFRTVGPEGDSWDEDEDGFLLRTLREIQLFDVSPVTYPAYEDSTSGVRQRTLEIVAERRNLPIDVVEADFRNIVLGERSEPGSVEGTTYALPIYDLPVDPVVALMALRSR
ncbi:HK97 family phage prohead protease [Micromonospora sp. PSH03]|uniref:HK97 family phage prohead protease n=1 Tax=Micromonospora salmantinae TaxID=2911211 RepID=UPI001EE7A490|nr:HK97 family phage prohead protease [Micromonospora salmantinae]MCG5459627.1 HK97 family phage prohead protease [Micromonospora salmantinae]